MKSEIKNVPEYAAGYRFIVYRMNNGTRWFWGAFSDGGKAAQVAAEVGGYVYDKEGGDEE